MVKEPSVFEPPKFDCTLFLKASFNLLDISLEVSAAAVVVFFLLDCEIRDKDQINLHKDPGTKMYHTCHTSHCEIKSHRIQPI